MFFNKLHWAVSSSAEAAFDEFFTGLLSSLLEVIRGETRSPLAKRRKNWFKSGFCFSKSTSCFSGSFSFAKKFISSISYALCGEREMMTRLLLLTLLCSLSAAQFTTPPPRPPNFGQNTPFPSPFGASTNRPPGFTTTPSPFGEPFGPQTARPPPIGQTPYFDR